MNEPLDDLSKLSDQELLMRLDHLVGAERENSVQVVLHLAETDRRNLWQSHASTLYAFCVKRWGYSEDVAVARATLARHIPKFPFLKQLLRCGKLSLSAARLLAPHLTSANEEALLSRAIDKTIHEVQLLIAEFDPQPDIADHIQHLPAGTSTSQPRQKIQPLSPGRMHYGFTGSDELLTKIKRARSLLWHKYPKGLLEHILDEALEAFLEKHDPDRKALRALKRKPKTGQPPAEGRRIPAWVKHEVWKRDEGKCVYETTGGEKCGEQSGLEYDHVLAFALGGRSDDPGNVRLLCSTHNQANAKKDFGEAASRHAKH